jgi:hypothetical protein
MGRPRQPVETVSMLEARQTQQCTGFRTKNAFNSSQKSITLDQLDYPYPNTALNEARAAVPASSGRAAPERTAASGSARSSQPRSDPRFPPRAGDTWLAGGAWPGGGTSWRSAASETRCNTRSPAKCLKPVRRGTSRTLLMAVRSWDGTALRRLRRRHRS